MAITDDGATLMDNQSARVEVLSKISSTSRLSIGEDVMENFFRRPGATCFRSLMLLCYCYPLKPSS